MYPMLPECIEEIIAFLAPLQRFTIATHLRFSFVQSRCLPVLEFATIEHASVKGQCDLLEKWKTSGLQFVYMDLALEYGHHFEWRKWSDHVSTKPNWFCYTLASAYGHIAVLEWWKNSGIPIPYHFTAMNIASGCGHVAVLEWWKNSGFDPLVYSFQSMDHASRNGHVAVLEWWKNSGLELTYDDALHEASVTGHVIVLEWWKESGLELKHYWHNMDLHEIHAVVDYPPDVVNWWETNKNLLLYPDTEGETGRAL